MKSFFKKLAFVMAMAMVVTLAAPAAANADDLLALALSVDGKTATDAQTIALDETVDFSFIGAKAGWRDLIVGWKSSNEAVAKVDGNGVVTPVAAGTTVISYELKGYEVAKATVTVKANEPEVVEPEFDYEQTDLKTVVLTFSEDVSKVKEEKVELYRVFTSTLGENIEVFWPIDGYSVKENTMTLSPFVKFGDHDHYMVVVNGEEYHFYTWVPELEDITVIEMTFGTERDKDGVLDGLAYVYDEDTQEDHPVWFDYVIKAGEMDVTELFGEQVAVGYELITPDPEDDSNAEILEKIAFNGDAEGGYISFLEKLTAVVGVKGVYATEDGTEVPVQGNHVVITPDEFPKFGLDSIIAWTLWDGETAKNKVQWNDQAATMSIPASQDNYRVVLKLKDTRGNVYVTDNGLADPTNANPNNRVYFIGADNSLLKDAIWFKYFSTNPDTFLVAESGDLTTGLYAAPMVKTYKEAKNAVIYVELHAPQEETEETFVDNIYVFRFNVTEPKEFTALSATSGTAKANAVTVNADALAGATSFLTKTITITPVDQAAYGSKTFSLAGIDHEYELTWSDEKAPAVNPTYSVDGQNNRTGKFEFTINGADLYQATGKTSLTLTIKEKESGISTQVKVTLAKPNWRDFSTEYKKTNGEIGYLSETDKDPVAVVNNKNHYKYDILIDMDGNFQKLNFAMTDTVVNLGFETGNSADEYVKKASILVNKSSSNLQVGSHDVSDYTIIDNAKWNEVTTGKAVGQRYVGLLGADGKLLLPAEGSTIYQVTKNTAGNGFDICFTGHDGDKMVYGKAGDYSLVIYTITSVAADGKFRYDTDTKNFKVQDDIKDPSFVERKAISTEYVDGDAYIKQIVADSFKFNLDKSEWKIKSTDVSAIASVDYINNGEYVIVKSVTFHVPVDNGVGLTTGEDYHVEKVDVNLSVELGVPAEE